MLNYNQSFFSNFNISLREYIIIDWSINTLSSVPIIVQIFMIFAYHLFSIITQKNFKNYVPDIIYTNFFYILILWQLYDCKQNECIFLVRKISSSHLKSWWEKLIDNSENIYIAEVQPENYFNMLCSIFDLLNCLWNVACNCSVQTKVSVVIKYSTTTQQ